MNMILYASGDFYLLQDWPDFKEGDARAVDIETALIERSKSNKIRITNTQSLPQWRLAQRKSRLVREGDIFNIPDELKVVIDPTGLARLVPADKEEKKPELPDSSKPFYGAPNVLLNMLCNLSYRCLQWEDGEIIGYESDRFERGCLSLLNGEHFKKFSLHPDQPPTIAELQNAYSDLGVKYDKDLERWQERDVKQRDRIKELESSLRASERFRIEDALNDLKTEPKKQDNQDELREMISKVHDHIEGRYDLDSYDLGLIHSLLCKLQKG